MFHVKHSRSLIRLFPFLNADKHSPVSSARSTKRRMSGCFCQWELKAPTDTNKSQPTTYCFAQLKQATCLIRVKRIFATRFATCRIIRNPPASGSLLMICHNRMLLRSLSGVACTTPDTSKSQPTAYCFEQLKQATCLIRLKCIFMHEHNQTGMPN